MLVNSSEALVKMLGNKATSILANFLRGEGATEISGAAATKYMSKLLRGNVVTGLATVAVMSTGDVINIFRGRISFGQLLKNVVNTSANVGGGLAGWQAGAAAGSTFGPAGTVIGGLIGAFWGSKTDGKLSQKMTDEMIEDDAKEMLRVFDDEWKIVAVDFMLNKDEQEQVENALKEELKSGSKLKDMYASNNRPQFARELLESCTIPIVKSRKKIYLPSSQDYVRGLRNVLEKVADNKQGKHFPQSTPKTSEPTKKIFACSVCGYTHAGEALPEFCPMRFYYFCAEDF